MELQPPGRADPQVDPFAAGRLHAGRPVDRPERAGVHPHDDVTGRGRVEDHGLGRLRDQRGRAIDQAGPVFSSSASASAASSNGASGSAT